LWQTGKEEQGRTGCSEKRKWPHLVKM